MSFYYPYKSALATSLHKLKEGHDYCIWRNSDESIDRRIKSARNPIIEIGGPTDLGFFFLENVPLPTEPRITNISLTPARYHPHASKLAKMIKEQLDATDMPYKDGSTSVFLMAAMSLSSDWWVNLSDKDKEKAAPKFENEFNVAKLEMGQVAAGLLDANDVKHAQRVMIFSEVHRCLEKGGLFFTDGGIEEIIILQKLGFELVECLQVAEDYGTSYEFVVVKRF